MQAEVYEKGMEGVLQLEENAHKAQNMSKPATDRCEIFYFVTLTSHGSLADKLMQPLWLFLTPAYCLCAKMIN